MLKATQIETQIFGLSLPWERGGVRYAIAQTLFILCFTLFNSPSFAQPRAQNDLFNVLQDACSNYLDATTNDNLDSLLTPQLQIISPPMSGNATLNSSYFSYCPQPGFTGSDQFRYSVMLDTSHTDTATIYLNVLPANNQINPGDADQNGMVEHFDVLAIGLAYNALGPSRDSLPNGLAWFPLPYINTDPGAADCNGDGIINDADVVAIDNNYLDTFPVLKPYVVDTSVCDANGIPFYIESLSGDSIMDGDTLVVSIRLGESAALNEAYGIAFTLEFDNGFVGGNQIQFSTSNSWLIQNDTPLFFKKNFQQTGEVQIALTKTNHIIANGGGEIMSAILPIDDNIDGIAVAPGWHDLKLNLVKARLISEYDIVRDVCAEQSSVKVYKLTTTANQLKKDIVKIYPNPNNGSFMIEGIELLEITVTDLAGKEIFTSKYNREGNAFIDLNEVAAGNYLVTVKTQESVFIQKLFIQP